MNLRVRLIVVFFLLSVVPLGAVTFYGYISNAAALREAAGREAELLAGELTERMKLVTAQISQRFERLIEVPSPAPRPDRAASGPAAGSGTGKEKERDDTVPTAAASAVTAVAEAVAQSRAEG